MELNPEISRILHEFKINVNEGTLTLLAIYFNLDATNTCSEEVIKAVNITKIVDKDYSSPAPTIKWNVPLFNEELPTAWAWVSEWVGGFKRVNPERAGSSRDAVTRMQDFFKKYPEYRKEDVFRARDLYFDTLIRMGGPAYCMKSHKFIFDGIGAMKKSTLLEYCEKLTPDTEGASNNMRGRVV